MIEFHKVLCWGQYFFTITLPSHNTALQPECFCPLCSQTLVTVALKLMLYSISWLQF